MYENKQSAILVLPAPASLDLPIPFKFLHYFDEKNAMPSAWHTMPVSVADQSLSSNTPTAGTRTYSSRPALRMNQTGRRIPPSLPSRTTGPYAAGKPSPQQILFFCHQRGLPTAVLSSPSKVYLETGSPYMIFFPRAPTRAVPGTKSFSSARTFFLVFQ